MRPFPVVLAALLFCAAAAPAWSQQTLHCSPCTHSFGKVQVGQSKTFSFQITNTGDSVIKMPKQPKKVLPFTIGHVPWKVNARASFTMTVTFTPTAGLQSKGVIYILSNAENSPLSIGVQGTGADTTTPQLGISPATLDFGNVNVGSSATLSATLKASNAPVTIVSDQSNSSEFVIQDLTLPVTIAAGNSIPVSIQFTPNASGKAVAKAGFISNALPSPSIEQLTGTGVAPGAHSVALTWESGDAAAVGYNVYRGTATSGPFSQINTALNSSTNFTDSNVVGGKTYYYVTTEVNTSGKESAYSNVATASVPSP
jgi:hypothetical protein